MLIISIVALLLAGLFFTRWWFLKREIRNASSQLTHYLQSSSQTKLDIALMDKDLEQLVMEVNLLMNKISQEKADKRRMEYELKMAIANISHDLRTPLTSISGYLQLLNGQDLSSEERQDYLGIAIGRANRLKLLLNEFFELSVIESMDYKLSVDKINMNDLLTDVLLGFYDAFTEKGMEPTINLSNPPLYVLADESALKRVMENLISNAICYGKSYVSVSLESSGHSVRLAVSNDINEPVDINLLFDRFYTADQSRSSGRGTGLGLAISKSLMEKMKGSITAKSESGDIQITCQWPEG